MRQTRGLYACEHTHSCSGQRGLFACDHTHSCSGQAGEELGTHRIEPRVLPVQRSPQGDAHMALTALFLEKAWNVTPRDTDRPGSGGSTQPEILPSA